MWSVLAGLGILPTAAAAYGLVRSALLDEPTGWLGAALAISLIVNGLLAFQAIRGWRYARDLESDMELIGEMWKEQHEALPPWLPTVGGALPDGNATFESLYEEALALGRNAVAPDARIGVGWINLSSPLISFNGFSDAAQKSFRIWVSPGRPPSMWQLERRSSPKYPVHEPYWRRDASWRELILKSWTVESPFHGSVTLWPRHGGHRPPAADEGWWEIQYSHKSEGVTGPSSYYCLVQDELEQLPRPDRAAEHRASDEAAHRPAG